jgi:hypothetical protein
VSAWRAAEGVRGAGKRRPRWLVPGA